MAFFESYLQFVSPTKKVEKIELRLCLEDASGQVNVADIVLQGGRLATLWNGHPAELRFSFE
jgi:hypothetical protein